MKKDNIVQKKSYEFALLCIRLFQKLTKEQHEYILSKQVLRSGTSIGANIEEAIGGQSAKDFLSKLSISYKEARETHYWLRLLRDSHYISNDESKSLIEKCEELLRIIGSIQKTTKLKIRNS
ncbi:four helix bundle protein [Aquimarina litoralis]|uniref:four helix bundle protein n=1 Tax=Aquimarina litoralis TaxID=584605 RepID=UPI001C59878F|nr:four helix bundle protein [Aquimarina litoralis]MBW1294479.1 four helix bundle protein [Aquimarina litoralis]